MKNVGPSTAIAILSGASPRDIATLIAREDVAGLTRIKGVGKKTAELLVVELHEKCELLVLSWNATGGAAAGRDAAGHDARGEGRRAIRCSTRSMTALVGMGWRPPRPSRRSSSCRSPTDATIEALLRQALRSMPR